LDRIVARSTACETQLVSLEAPFGQVIGGYLEIEAPLTELTYKRNRFHYRTFGVQYFDMKFDPSTNPGYSIFADVSLLCIVREAQTLDEENFARKDTDTKYRRKDMEGLILEKRTEDDTFFRIGKFDIE
jgi:hypothetical protein